MLILEIFFNKTTFGNLRITSAIVSTHILQNCNDVHRKYERIVVFMEILL
jgi:hypothetical protein